MTVPTITMGILVGGNSSRMRGFPKGLLRHPREKDTLVEHLCGLARQLQVPCVLVGEHPAYLPLRMPVVPDAEPDAGPMGGVVGFLREVSTELSLVVACDLPFVQRPLLDSLIEAAQLHPDAAAVLPRRDGGLEPTCAVYRRALALPSLEKSLQEGRFGLQRWARSHSCVAVEIPDDWAAWLDDWDSPEDMSRS